MTRCPKCGEDSGVHDSRHREDGSIRRRRHCVGCGEKWGTIEIHADRLAHLERSDSIVRAMLAVLDESRQ